jgi:hypothetical protein
MQSIEIDRINSLEQLIKKLTIQLNLLAKKMAKVVEVFESIEIDISSDIKIACKKYGTCQNEQEIYLYDIFAENTKNMMNKDRRIANLNKWSQLFEIDVKSQANSLQGIVKMKSFTKENPNFNANNDVEVNQKVESCKALKILYEASLFKVKSALCELGDSAEPKPTYEHSSIMQTTYDKQGVPLTVLKLPVSYFNNSANYPTSSVKNSDSASIYRPSAPSVPSSPTRNSLNFPSGSTFTLSSTSSSAYSSLKENNSSNAPAISMPMPTPYNLNSYDGGPVINSRSTSSFTNNNYAGIETSSSSSSSSSSGSSISTNSSVSPAALSSLSSNSSTHMPSHLPLPLASHNSSYLLTTANSNFPSSSSNNNNKSVTSNQNYDHPPSYVTATNLKKNKAITNPPSNANTAAFASNAPNFVNSTEKIATDGAFFNKNNKNCKKFIENHYNNSVQSSDGNRLELFYCFFFILLIVLSQNICFKAHILIKIII